jgi:hypothetical protein
VSKPFIIGPARASNIDFLQSSIDGEGLVIRAMKNIDVVMATG